MNFRMQSKRIWGGVLGAVIFIALGVSLLLPIPYFAMGPGSAIDVSPLVHVGTSQPDEKGTFLLTTISLKEGNVFDYLYSKITGQTELVPEREILAQGESEEEYARRQAENMIASQNNAIIAAYRQAGRPVKVEVSGIEIFQLLKNRNTGLKEGDLIKKVDGRAFSSTEQLIQYLGTKTPGEVVTVNLIRGKKQMEKKVELVELPAAPGEKKRAGLGIIPVVRVKVNISPPAEIHTQNIGGPSAGLMFSLEVLNRLLPEDLTKGYRIAGTGTISQTGEVGQIGGIQYKVIAADREDAEIFFCPRDREPGDENEKTARETAEKIGTPMKIVPVSSLQEAVRYLQHLPARSAFKSKTLTGAA
ncbi:SepM family pheromone-processing serine protease [Lihuaxuella thermophila]|uniref:endopeptidase La n=1 Tax=Lihuaxuella thermophila TaxID=1173111 RepID=A0A1H8E852_9BACL|nr:SepM family pheromone-processing serine protease [Lihuaxuella thermophila]SEN15580.1 PDZ domain-containing protein [Lihuaxuella thermophila]